MSDIPLTGLAGGHPLGFLAALGVLRCCDELDGFAGARLSWRDDGGWHANLHAPGSAGPEELLARLAERARGRDGRPEVTWADTLAVSPGVYREATALAESAWSAGAPSAAEFLAGFACEVTPGRDTVAPTHLSMTSGQQRFLRECRGVLRALADGCRIGRRVKPPADLFREALLGPWRYEDPYHSLGWDPSTERVHALLARSPTRDGSRGVVGAVGLAFEALPLLPCLPVEGRTVTTGFHSLGVGRDRKTYFTWPLWDAPLGSGPVRSVLALLELTRERPPAASLRERGVRAVFRSERYRLPTQGAYYLLRTPTRLV